MFTHLHVHTEYSMLDGLSRIEPLVNQAVELGMHSLAITDHGGMYGVVDFFQTAKKLESNPSLAVKSMLLTKVDTIFHQKKSTI